MAKGAFYPAFIAAASGVGIPLKMAEQAVYLAASAVLASLIRSRAVGTALFAALAFVPVAWTVELARVIREGLYLGLSLGTLGAAAAIATAPTGRSAAWRGAGLGLVGGAFWLTREEGVWLAPAVAAVLALGAWRTGWRPTVRPVVAAGLAWGVLVGGNVALNRQVYGVAETVDVRSSAFRHAYGAISRIQHERWQPYVVFPADARALAYRVSPAARELRPFFDGPGGEAWRQTGCRDLPERDCSEILSPWFQWALRDAVQQAGHYRTARDAERFYGELGREIDAACQSGEIACLAARATLAAPFRWSDVTEAVGPAGSLVAMLATLGGTAIRSDPSLGSPGDVEGFAEMVGPVARRPVVLIEIMGRLSGGGSVRVQPVRAVPEWTSTTALDAADGFTLSTDCPAADCALVVSAGGQDVATLPLASLPPRLVTPAVTLDLVRVRQVPLHGGSLRGGRVVLAVTRAIGRGYALLGPVLLLAGGLGVVLTVAWRRDLVRTPLFALVLGSLVAVAGRIALLAYVHVTAIPSVNLLYLSPAIPLAIVFGVGGAALLVACGRAWWSRFSATAWPARP